MVSYDSARRARVADILERQNRAWDASPKTLENIDRLRQARPPWSRDNRSDFSAARCFPFSRR